MEYSFTSDSYTSELVLNKKGNLENPIDIPNSPHEGNRLRSYRISLGVTFDELADKTGLRISELKSLEQKIYVERAVSDKIFKALGAKLDIVRRNETMGPTYGSDYIHVGGRARTYRMCRGISAVTIAERLKLSPKRLRTQEMQAEWPLFLLYAYAKALGITMQTLLKTVPRPPVLGSEADPIGPKIVRCMTQVDMTQKQLAAEIGCHPKNIGKLLRKKTLSLRTVYRIASAIEVSINEIQWM